jgi:polyferredoxin
MVVATSVFYERRTFCKTLCFLGGLAGNYARSGAVKVQATPDICKTCKVQSCYKGTEKVEGCPMFQFPRTMESSAECNICGNCVKNCPNNSIKIETRIPTKELWGLKNPKLEHASLAAVIMGIVFVQNITMLEPWQGILKAIGTVTGTSSYVVNFTVAFIIAMALPILLLLGIWHGRHSEKELYSLWLCNHSLRPSRPLRAKPIPYLHGRKGNLLQFH